MTRFRLHHDPFPDCASDGFFFATPALSRRLAELRDCLEHGHALVLDEAGSGKSTLLARLGEERPEGWRFASVVARHDEGADGLLARIVAALGLARRDPPAAQLRDLDAFLEVLAARRQLAVLAVDAAQALGGESLGFLLYLARRWKAFPIRFLLGADPRLGDAVAAHQQGHHLLERARILGVPRLGRAEVGDYLHMRLYRAGLEGDSPFTAEVVDRLAAQSGGRPGALHPLARRVVRGAGRARRGARVPAPPRARAGRWALGMLAVAALVGALLAGQSSLRAPRADSSPAARVAGFHSSVAPTGESSSATARRPHP